MPSHSKQVNVRVNSAQEAMLPALCAAVSAATGLTVTNSDLFRMGMHELAKKYLPDGSQRAPHPTTVPSRKKRAKK